MMNIRNETELRRLLDMQATDTNVLVNIAQKVCIDLKYLIENADDDKIIEYAAGKLDKIKACLQDVAITSEYIDETKHKDNYLCRNAEFLLNRAISNRANYGQNEIQTSFQKYINSVDSAHSVYANILYLRFELVLIKQGGDIDDDEAMRILQICSQIKAVEPGNVLCNELITEIRNSMSKKLQNSLVNTLDTKLKNDRRISELQSQIDDVRREMP